MRAVALSVIFGCAIIEKAIRGERPDTVTNLFGVAALVLIVLGV